MYFPEQMTFQYLFFNTYVGYFLQIVPILLATGMLYIIYKKKRNKITGSDSIVGPAMFICYFVGLICLTLFQSLIADMYYYAFYGNFSSSGYGWFTFEYDISPDIFNYADPESMGNILIYIPFGILFPLFYERSTWIKTVFCGGMTSILIELIQPTFGRRFDIDDIILNTFGAILSATTFFIIRGMKTPKSYYKPKMKYF